MVTLEMVLQPENLRKALQQVVANKGVPGVDGMTVEELLPWIKSHPHELTEQIRRGRYRQHPVLRKYIPKDNGEQRPLGIPRVIDRFVQQATAQVLSDAYEPKFSDNSYGFRPNRCAQDAINKVLENANEGYEYVVDLDLAKFFDTVNHSKLLQVLSETIKDGRVISLIHKFLRAKIQDGKEVRTPTMGTPQGGPISPILANILLNELDQELERRNHRFVRYADDMMIMCKSIRAAKRTYEAIVRYITEKLFLKINEDKTKVCGLGEDVKFLGFSFYKGKDPKDGDKTRWEATVHRKSWAKLKDKVRAIMDRRCPNGVKRTQEYLKTTLRGWANYFRTGIHKSRMREVDGWIGRRIRQMYWKQWKRIRTRYDMLKKYGVGHNNAYQWANTSKGYWKIAGSWILATTLTNKVLEEEGWVRIRSFVKL